MKQINVNNCLGCPFVRHDNDGSLTCTAMNDIIVKHFITDDIVEIPEWCPAKKGVAVKLNI